MRLIDADELYVDARFGENEEPYVSLYQINDASTVDAEPVRHGRWRYDKPLGLEWCSECGFGKRNGDKRWYSYCPNCGAKMDEVAE